MFLHSFFHEKLFQLFQITPKLLPQVLSRTEGRGLRAPLQDLFEPTGVHNLGHCVAGRPSGDLKLDCSRFPHIILTSDLEAHQEEKPRRSLNIPKVQKF